MKRVTELEERIAMLAELRAELGRCQDAALEPPDSALRLEQRMEDSIRTVESGGGASRYQSEDFPDVRKVYEPHLRRLRAELDRVIAEIRNRCP